MSAVEVGHVMTADRARALTDRIKDTLSVAYEALIECWHGRADQALGYESWEAYCATEFAQARMVRLARDQRQEIVAQMRSEGMSTRAISSGLGISKNTAADDSRRLSQGGTDGNVATVTSLDGRKRPASNVREINAHTPQSLIDADRDETDRALPAYHVSGLVNELLSEPIEDAEQMVRNLPDYVRPELDRVPEAIDYLTRIEQARRNT